MSELEEEDRIELQKYFLKEEELEIYKIPCSTDQPIKALSTALTLNPNNYLTYNFMLKSLNYNSNSNSEKLTKQKLSLSNFNNP